MDDRPNNRPWVAGDTPPPRWTYVPEARVFKRALLFQRLALCAALFLLFFALGCLTMGAFNQ